MNAPPPARPLHVFLVAGEESGDRLGAALIAALRERTKGQVRVSGVGGAHMAREGVSPFPLGDLAIIGVSAIPRRLPLILKRIREAADAAIAAKPDVLVIIDSPDFTHRVARRVRARAPQIPIVDYVCPSVWAWRPGRARKMLAYVDLVLGVLPFEPAAMQKLNGPRCVYVGHPLAEEVPRLRPAIPDEEQRRNTPPPVLIVMPGSRSSEIRRFAKIFGETAARVAEQTGPLDVVVPAVPHLAESVKAAVANWPVPARVVIERAEKEAAFRIARAALAKSGTSTLELALAGIPMVAAYTVTLIEELIARAFVTAPSAILTNLILGENVVPEFLQRDCTVENLSSTLVKLVQDTPERRRQTDAFARLDDIMQIGKAVPSARAAQHVFETAINHAHASGE
jgi:lipid-A-disaccharide synthase